MTLFVGTFIIGNIAGDKKSDNNATASPPTLEQVLSDVEDSERVMSYRSAEDIELFDGEAKIIWSDGEEYNVIRLSGEFEKNRLNSAMNQSFARAKAVGEDDNVSVLVWISYGDGRVITPYLKNTVGNVGYGEFFEYDPEIVPTEELSDFVNDLIS